MWISKAVYSPTQILEAAPTS
uniref:Uncharacterized protein n=1 Tax=Anguilla anguilla TaxID=7936 RepID=A0A0E9VCT3_ANGAN